MRTPSKTQVVLRLLFLLAVSWPLGCSPDPSATPDYRFVLRIQGGDVPGAAERVALEISRQMERAAGVPHGYPQRGHIVTSPHPKEAGVQVLHCQEGDALEAQAPQCIKMDDEDAFVRVEAITWQSAAHHMFMVYVLPPSPLARVDPTRNYVAIDILGVGDAARWQVAEGAIRSALRALGARVYSP